MEKPKLYLLDLPGWEFQKVENHLTLGFLIHDRGKIRVQVLRKDGFFIRTSNNDPHQYVSNALIETVNYLRVINKV